MTNYILKNLKSDRLVNLGTKEGKMLLIQPNSSITISQDMLNLFDFEIERAMIGGFINIERIEERIRDIVTEDTKGVIKE